MRREEAIDPVSTAFENARTIATTSILGGPIDDHSGFTSTNLLASVPAAAQPIVEDELIDRPPDLA